ncbi:MAG: 3-dehydro-L-gulonate 2-dehydrogenase [Sphaerochaetaceae bacterium]|nr:3-dehydro-L-gulonate 2-dehydrogenase [Sphaerochaetaceae bacterium]
MVVKFDELVKVFAEKFEKKGVSHEDAVLAGTILAQNSADGVYSHGVNRFPRVMSYIDKGYIDPKAKCEKVDSIGSFERWDGHLALGMVNAKLAMDRAIELAKQHGIGLVAIKNTNHWMRGGTYGWQAADAGCIGMCWTNTQPNMPAWGAKDRRIGNNPFVIAVPRESGEHVVLDCAMSQFSYGKIEMTKFEGKQLPVPGGFDEEGNMTTDPAAIEKTWRVMPVGYWKGSGMSILLDLVAAILAGGNSVTDIGKMSSDEYGLSQVLIAIDPSKMNEPGFTEALIKRVVEDIAASIPAEEGKAVRYPGQNSLKTRRENMKNGIPVLDSVWETIMAL